MNKLIMMIHALWQHSSFSLDDFMDTKVDVNFNTKTKKYTKPVDFHTYF